MDDYKDMYYKLFNAITDVRDLLEKVQTEAEELFISQETPETVLQDEANE